MGKSTPSCTSTVMMNLMRMSKKDKINIQKSKIYKHYSCSQIYLYVANFNLNTNYLIKYFNISRTTYYRFKSKFNLLSPVDIFKNNLPIPHYHYILVRNICEQKGILTNLLENIRIFVLVIVAFLIELRFLNKKMFLLKWLEKLPMKTRMSLKPL